MSLFLIVPYFIQCALARQVNISVDASNVIGNLPPVTRFFGADEPNEAVYPDGTALIHDLGDLGPHQTQLDLAVKYGVNLVGTLTWAFEFSNHAFFDKSRVLATNQINKPILNIFRMFGKMQTKRLEAMSTGQYPTQSVLTGSVRGDPDVGVLASSNEVGTKMTVMIWNHHDDDLPKPDAQIKLDVSNAFAGSDEAKVTHYRIDQSHSNAYARWLAMGSPQDPTPQQYANLQAAGDLAMLHEPTMVQLKDGSAEMQYNLPIHAASLLVIEQPQA